jgi:maltose-binding protein MalE
MPRLWSIGFVLMFCVSACNALANPTPLATSTILPKPSSTSPRADDSKASTITPAPVLTATRNLTLTVWTTEELSPSGARGGRVLKSQIDAFSKSRPNLRVDFILKKATGTGGLVDFLVNTQAAAPQMLPDLILLDSRELDSAAQTGLVQPLDSDLPAGIYADLFPSAQKVARINGAWVALPMFLEAEHLVYNQARLARPPRTWSEVISSPVPFLFPAEGDDGFIAQYLSLGGSLSDANSNPALNADTMVQVLSFYRRARDANVIPDSTLGIKSVDESWATFISGQNSIAQVGASQYLADRDRFGNVTYSNLPTRDGQVMTLTRAWVMAVTASNPARKQAAIDLLQWLSASSRLSEWASSARKIPARRTAFATAIDPPEYAQFLRGLLDKGTNMPSVTQLARLAPAYRAAVQSVLRGQSTPIEAANRAVNSIK